MIQAIEEYDTKDKWYAHMAIEFKLEDAKTNQIVWKKLFDAKKLNPAQSFFWQPRSSWATSPSRTS